MTDSGKKPVCFLELVTEARDFLAHCQRDGISPEDVEIVALSIEVQAFLKHRGIGYRNTLSVFGNPEHERVIGLIDTFHARFESLVNLDLEEGVIRKTFTDSAVYVAQYYINYFLYVTTIVDAAVVGAEYVITGETGVELVAGVGQEFGPPHIALHEDFASAIVGEYCKQNGIEVRMFKRCAEKPERGNPEIASAFSGRPLGLLYRALERMLPSRQLVLFVGGGGTNGNAIPNLLAKDHLRTLSLRDTIGFSQVFAGWARFLGIIPGQIPIPLERGDGTLTAELGARLDGFQADCLAGQLVHKNVDFWSIFGLKITDQLLPFLRRLAVRVERLLKTLERLPVDYVVATGAREENFAAGEWATAMDIPFVMVPHGTAIKPANVCEDIENRNLGRSLLLSPVVSIGVLQSKLDALHVAHYKPDARTVETGPILYCDRDAAGRRVPIRRKPAGEPITIMVGSSYKSRGMYRFWAMETPDEYLRSCQDIVQAVNALGDGTRVLIRCHPKLTMTDTDLRSLLPDSDVLDIERGGRFLDSLEKCQLVVNFSSSSIEESLQNDIPVLLYDPWDRYQHCAAQAITDPERVEPSAVYYLNNRESLSKTLATISERHLRADVDIGRLFEAYQYPDNHIHHFVDLFSASQRASDN